MSTITAKRPPTRTRHAASRAGRRPAATLLGAYQLRGRRRQVVAIRRRDGAVLVIDWLAAWHAEPRLVGCLDPDEAPENARILCELYLADPSRGHCRRLRRGDLNPPATPRAAGEIAAAAQRTVEDGERRVYRIAERHSRCSLPQLRWTCDSEREPLSVRRLIGRLQAYEPARSITEAALARHEADARVSTCTLRDELERVNASRVVLNRGLREAVLARVATGQASVSEIAMRCGRIKRSRGGSPSGETSWLMRRIGVAAETPGGAPTPWVHSDVLALIARAGLHVPPREIEVQ